MMNIDQGSELLNHIWVGAVPYTAYVSKRDIQKKGASETIERVEDKCEVWRNEREEQRLVGQVDK